MSQNYVDYLNGKPLDMDALLADLYELQASLKILIEQLAISRQPELSAMTLCVLADMNGFMRSTQPSLRRH